MFTFFVILVIIACIILVLFILAQNPKGGGLSSTFGGATQIIGARQTADFLEKASWYLAIGILAVVLITNFFVPSGATVRERESKFRDQIEALPTNIPQNPTSNAAQQQAQQQGKVEAQQPAAKQKSKNKGNQGPQAPQPQQQTPQPQQQPKNK